MTNPSDAELALATVIFAADRWHDVVHSEEDALLVARAVLAAGYVLPAPAAPDEASGVVEVQVLVPAAVLEGVARALDVCMMDAAAAEIRDIVAEYAAPALVERDEAGGQRRRRQGSGNHD